MAEDIAPALLEKVEKAFRFNLRKAGIKQSEIIKRAKEGKFRSINQYSRKVGKALADAFTEVITPEALPDGTFYYNIANRVLKPPIAEAHRMVSEIADEMQIIENTKIGIGIKPIRPPIQMDRVDGLIDILTSGFFEDNIDYLNEPIRNLVDHFGDYHVEKNVEFLDSSGVGIVVIRTADSTSCEWCAERAGVYDGYQEAQYNDAFARHEGCRCELEIRGGGRSGKMRTAGHAFVKS